MEKMQYIIKPLWKWLVSFPFALIGFYDLYRQEINPNAPLLIGILGNWNWKIWLLLFLLILIIAIIEGVIRLNSQVKTGEVRTFSLNPKKQRGGISTSQLINYGTINQGANETKIETSFNQIPVEMKFDIRRLRLAEKGQISRLETEPNQPTIDEYSLTLVNETGQDLKRCFVLLDEVSSGKVDTDEWNVEIVDLLEKPFRWNSDTIYIDGKIDIENDERARFTFLKSTRSVITDQTTGRQALMVNCCFVFFDKDGTRLDFGKNYRLLLSIRGRNQDSRSFMPVKYYLYIHVGYPIPNVKFIKIERVDNI